MCSPRAAKRWHAARRSASSLGARRGRSRRPARRSRRTARPSPVPHRRRRGASTSPAPTGSSGPTVTQGVPAGRRSSWNCRGTACPFSCSSGGSVGPLGLGGGQQDQVSAHRGVLLDGRAAGCGLTTLTDRPGPDRRHGLSGELHSGHGRRSCPTGGTKMAPWPPTREPDSPPAPRTWWTSPTSSRPTSTSSPIPTTSPSRSPSARAGHRGTSLTTSFNEAHIAATTQAICDYRTEQGYDGPLFIGRDTHAPVRARLGHGAGGAGRQRRHGAGRRPRRLHPDPCGLHAILRANQRTARPAPGSPTASWSRRRTTRPTTAASSTTRPTAARPTPTPPASSRPAPTS